MTWQERWQRLDPMQVLERKQENKLRKRRGAIEIDPFGALWARGKIVMTNDESQEVEALLMGWFGFAQAWRPDLGGGRCSSYCKQFVSQASPDDNARMLEKIQAEAVEFCLDSLSVWQRAAVGIHCANKRAGNQLLRNPRMTIEQHHQQYQQAKADLLPLLRARDLIRTPAAVPKKRMVINPSSVNANNDVAQLARLEQLSGVLKHGAQRPTITLRGLLKKCLPGSAA